jgi:hypothetical protein
MFVMFTEGLDQSIGGFQRKKFGAGTYVPFRKGQNVPEKIFFCPFKKSLKKWNSILTNLKIPCKFERYRLRKMALDTNGLKRYAKIYSSRILFGFIYAPFSFILSFNLYVPFILCLFSLFLHIFVFPTLENIPGGRISADVIWGKNRTWGREKGGK